MRIRLYSLISIGAKRTLREKQHEKQHKYGQVLILSEGASRVCLSSGFTDFIWKELERAALREYTNSIGRVHNLI